MVYSVWLWKYDISDPTKVDLISNFFVLSTNLKVLYIIMPIIITLSIYLSLLVRSYMSITPGSANLEILIK